MGFKRTMLDYVDELFRPIEEPTKYQRLYAFAAWFLLTVCNYADRLAPSALLADIRNTYSLDADDRNVGLIVTVEMAAMGLASPLYGFLGDRFSRKWIIVAAQILMCFSSFASTLIPAEHFWLFLVCRGISGVGQAAVIVIIPTIIGDMFSAITRSRAIMCLHFSIPVGGALGFTASAWFANKVLGGGDDWRWGIRLLPFLVFISLVVVVCVAYEPIRGAIELKGRCYDQSSSDFISSTLVLAKNLTFVFLTFGNTALAFAAGTFTWWMPALAKYANTTAASATSVEPSVESSALTTQDILGVVVFAGGLTGIFLGSCLSEMLVDGRLCLKPIKQADAVVCMVGSIVLLPMLIDALHVVEFVNKTAFYSFLFVTSASGGMSWAVAENLLFSIAVPTRWSTAHGWLIFAIHTFGDCPGPFIVGAIADAVRTDNTPTARFRSLFYGFYAVYLAIVLSIVFYGVCVFTTKHDQRNCAAELAEMRAEGDFSVMTAQPSMPSSATSRPQQLSQGLASNIPSASAKN